MKTLIPSSVAISAILLLAGCATQMSNDPTAPTGPPSATLTVDEWKAAYYGSTASGSGTIDFNGSKRKFTLTSLGGGGAGLQNIQAVGKVYNLDSLADFPGTYTGASSGLTLLEGKMHERIANGNGVVIYITGATTGLSTSMGIEQLLITLD